ncbi:hypothetical protein V2G26_010454 [Clonostachys chloroleuca]
MAAGKAPSILGLEDPSIFKDQAYINGEWVEAKSGKRFEIIDPGTGKPWATCTDAATEDVENAVLTAYDAFLKYRTVNPRQRADKLAKWDALIRKHREDLARILVYETGKPLAEALGEVEYAASFTRWFAGEAERIQGTTFTPSIPGRRVVTIKQPVGVTAALVPWNFPIAMILRKAATALAAGCTMIVKPSPETPLSALSLAHLAEQAGFEKGVLSVLPTTLANTPSLSEALCKHPLVKKVSFTGSTRVGKLLAAHCADTLKKLTLELGGNCPFLIFDDANLDQAVEALMPLKFRHAGQACITANRIYVQRGVYGKFSNLVAEHVGRLRVGHGIDKETTMGPLTVPAGLDKVASQIKDATELGAKVLTGGKRIDKDGGYYFEPTVINEVTPKMKVANEEHSDRCWLYCRLTPKRRQTWRLLENLEAGMIGMNTGNASAAESPFGGIKDSGFGKESGKDVAINEYLITKTGTLTLEGQY